MPKKPRPRAERRPAAPAARPPAPAAAPAPRPLPRGLLFAALCAVALVVAAGYLGLAAQRTTATAQRALGDTSADAATLAAVRARPHLVFLQTDGDAYRRVALVPLDAPDGPRYLTDLQCQRVYVAAGGGLCLGRDFAAGGAVAFDAASMRPRQVLPAGGLPSRARLSPDGRFGATTVFVRGDSYAAGGFSTRTGLFDLGGEGLLADLEQFAVYRDGRRFEAVDFNFWAVTFAGDGNRFYATLASGGRTYLLEGDLAARQARVLRENVECPSLSPDGTRLVFKKQVEYGNPAAGWRLHLLDLATLEDRPLAESGSVDDQVEWLDAGTILYALPDRGPPATIRPDVWALAVDDPAATPRLLLTGAMSPAVVR